MKLRFPRSHIRSLAALYDAELGDRDKGLTETIMQKVFPSYQRKGYLTKEEFLTVCLWKSPRSKLLCESNDPAFIREISALVLKTASEQFRIQAWTLLTGVSWPTASVFLHFALSNKYPIMDFRALWSLRTDVPGQYTFSFWQEYTAFCRDLARQSGVTMRVLDKALWKYSAMNQ